MTTIYDNDLMSALAWMDWSMDMGMGIGVVIEARSLDVREHSIALRIKEMKPCKAKDRTDTLVSETNAPTSIS